MTHEKTGVGAFPTIDGVMQAPGGPDEDLEVELDKLLAFGGFPEPFLNGTSRFYNRWKKSHLDIILKQDLIDLENVQQITQIEILNNDKGTYNQRNKHERI
jgi:predicted AAA+ superfamily ATPase